MGIYVNFTKNTHQMWSCHVTLASNFEKFHVLPNSLLNFRKNYQIWGKLAQEQKSYKQKNKLGGGNTPPPVLIGLEVISVGRSSVLYEVPEYNELKNLFAVVNTVVRKQLKELSKKHKGH